MVQLVSLNYARKRKKGQNEGNVAIHRGNGKQKKREIRERKTERRRKEKSKTDSKVGTFVQKERKK